MSSVRKCNKLECKYNLYFHHPNDSNWNLDSYQTMTSFEYIEDVCLTFANIPSILFERGMIFLMKENVNPMWEDSKNIHGGSFCYKVSKKSVLQTFKILSYALCGKTLSSNMEFLNNITGITVSPKQGDFCIIKIWLCDMKYQDPTIVSNFHSEITHVGCIFKKHKA